MADLADLERRVEALEKAHNANTGTLKWISGTLGQVAAEIAGLREETSKRFDAVEGNLSKVESDLSGFRREFREFQQGQASMIAEVMREVLSEKKG